MRRLYYFLFTVIFFSAVHAFSQDVCAPVGWATQNGGVTGGGNATPVVCSTYSQLDNAVDDDNVKVIHVSGTITVPGGGRIVFQDQANKSILGLPGARLVSGDQSSSGSGIMQMKRCDNVIIRNLIFEGPGAYDVDGNDNLTIEDSRNVWIDHCVFEDGCDGNLDIKSEADFISVTWTIFRYRKPPRAGGPGGSDDHRYSNLFGSSDGATGDRGKLRITMQYCQWGEGVRERMPRIRFGRVHMVNNLFNSDVDNYCIRAGFEADILAEGNVFIGQSRPIDEFDNDYTAILSRNNIGASNLTRGTAFTPPYTIDINDASNVQALVESCAGATLNAPNGCSTCTGGGVTDCNGDQNGSAYTDNCGRCVGGNTGVAPCATSLSEGIYRIHPVHSNLCMASNNPSTQETCASVAAQYWNVTKDGNNYRIQSLDNDQYLSPGNNTQGENTGLSNSPVSLTLADAGNGNFYIQPSNNETLVFDILNISTATGMPAILWVNTGATNQHFTFEPVSVQLDCNGDINGAASLDACGVCTGGNTGVSPCAGAIQGEDFCFGNGVEEADNAGYQGAGYFNYDNAAGNSATWYINASNNQNYTIAVRYANGGGTARPLNVFVNGNQQGTISGNATGAWTTWTSEAISLNLNSGSNEITMTATSADGGPNLDLIALVSGLSDAQCSATPTDCNGDPNGSAYIDGCGSCVGGNTGQQPCANDCNGTPGGSAYLDNCGTCVGGTTGQTACTTDCNGVPGGNAYIDGCGSCVGGNTGQTACTPTCDDVGVVFGQIGYSTQGNGTTGGAGGDEVTVTNGVDLQNAINDATGPRIIYIDGTINVANSTGLSKIDIKDVSDISIIGLQGALFDGIGLKIWRASNIIIQNVTVRYVLTGDKDGLNIEGPSNNIWVDHCEFYNEYEGVDKDYYDALLDLKRDVDHVTISWNYFHDSWKCSLSGSSETDTYNRTVTYHHNFYENINSRLPLFRSGEGHMFNNYYKDIHSTTINSRIDACVKVENNYFLNAQNPYVSAYSDVVGYGDVSGNILENSPFVYASDVFELGACTANIPYDYSNNLNCAENVPSIVSQYAGVDKTIGTVNLPPTVSITAPSNGATFDDPATINITANANDSDGSVVSVEFFQNNNSLGTDNSAPFSYNWTGVTAGTYTIKVVATDDDGATAESSINVTVNAANLDCAGVPNGGAYYDNCNVCVGGNTGLDPCTQDCAGTWGGTEVFDDCGVCGGSNACVDCNGDPNGSASLDACGVCAGGNTGVTACSGSIQAETACTVDGTVDSDNAGFNGSGFVNTTNAVGANMVLSINATNAGTASVGFTYANGGGTDRPATVIVNGSTVGTLTFATTGEWETWVVESMDIDFNAGGNTIELVATSAGGIANLDQLIFTASGFTAGSCNEDCNGDLGGGATTDACGKCIGGNTGATSDDADGDGVIDCEDAFPNDFDNDGVPTAEDCDDTNASIITGTTWYADLDGDGIGDASSSIVACDQPTDYVTTSGDQCPTDANKTNPGQCGCNVPDVDSDADGILNCNDPFPNDKDNDGVSTIVDCDDNDPNVGATQTWYEDVDGDGVGDASSSVQDCTPPSGYVATAGDACPNDINKTDPGNCGCGQQEGTCLDCAGVANGSASFDDCGVCSGGTTGIAPNSTCSQDCAGIWGGTAAVDNCDVCSGGSTGITPNSTCTQDCAGIWDGNASIDNCNVCSGGTTGITPNSTCTQDCNGVWGGTAFEDNCGNCVASQQEACTQDCFGDWGGSAAFDACNDCAGGNTGITPVTDPTLCIATSLDEDLKHNIQVYPNPAVREFTVKAEGDFSYKLYTISGVLILAGQGEGQVNIGGDLVSGTYLLEVLTETTDVYITKVVKH